MTNKEIELLYNSIKVRSYIKVICNKQGRYDLTEDLLQFCIMKLIEKDSKDIKKNLKKYKKTLEDYFIGLIVNQINSNTSEFFKVYRNNGFFKSVDIDKDYEYEKLKELPHHNEFDDNYYINKDVKETILLDKIKKAMRLCDPFKIDLFKMKYYEDKSYKEISQYYNIPIQSVINKVKSVKNNIKSLLESDFSIDEIIKRQKEISRNYISKSIKEKIIKEYNDGETKRSLSKRYNVSYPVILKIIKRG